MDFSELLLLSALENVFLLQNSLCSMSLMVLTVCWAPRKCVWFVNNSTNWKRSRQVLCREKREDEMQGYMHWSLICYSVSFSISFSCSSWHFWPFLDHYLSLHAFPLLNFFCFFFHLLDFYLQKSLPFHFFPLFCKRKLCWLCSLSEVENPSFYCLFSDGQSQDQSTVDVPGMVWGKALSVTGTRH